MKALYFNEFGNSSVLTYGELPGSKINKHDVLIKMTYIGLNFADIYRRRGTYHIEKNEPYINGYEGVGTITKIGTSVTKHKMGEKVFFADSPFANAEYVSVDEEKAIKLPENINEKLVATIALQGLTADFLAHDLGMNTHGDKVFIHGISGGVG